LSSTPTFVELVSDYSQLELLVELICNRPYSDILIDITYGSFHKIGILPIRVSRYDPIITIDAEVMEDLTSDQKVCCLLFAICCLLSCLYSSLSAVFCLLSEVMHDLTSEQILCCLLSAFCCLLSYLRSYPLPSPLCHRLSARCFVLFLLYVLSHVPLSTILTPNILPLDALCGLLSDEGVWLQQAD
jgi:hypothetical protein